MSQDINTTDQLITCPECYGDGKYEVGPECTRPASNCCGGCYYFEKCEECDGTGEIDNPNFEDYE